MLDQGSFNFYVETNRAVEPKGFSSKKGQVFLLSPGWYTLGGTPTAPTRASPSTDDNKNRLCTRGQQRSKAETRCTAGEIKASHSKVRCWSQSSRAELGRAAYRLRRSATSPEFKSVTRARSKTAQFHQLEISGHFTTSVLLNSR